MGNQNKTVFFRVEKNKNYSVINNEFLKRDDLSWKAKGILAYVLSLPNDWIINIDEVMNHATEGKAAFRSGWNELVEAGYIERNPIREKQRIRYWETIVKEKPGITAIPLLTDFQEVENQEVEKAENEAERIPYKKIIDYLNEKTGKRFNSKTKGNQSLIKARWNEGYRLEQFNLVVDNMVENWTGQSFDGKPAEQYLQPSTLFGNKFDKYLNQMPKDKTAWAKSSESSLESTRSAPSDPADVVYPDEDLKLVSEAIDKGRFTPKAEDIPKINDWRRRNGVKELE